MDRLLVCYAVALVAGRNGRFWWLLLLPAAWMGKRSRGLCVLLAGACLSLGWACRIGAFHASLPVEGIVELEGVAGDDAALLRFGGYRVPVRVERVGDGTGRQASAHGVVEVLLPGRLPVLAGTRLRVSGRWKDERFRGRTWKVVEVPRLARVRAFLLDKAETLLERRIRPGRARELARMLLLGRYGKDAFPLKDLALASGCSHILALSGMHLAAVSSLAVLAGAGLFGLAGGACFGLGCALAFVFLAGPKPSLVRALLCLAFRRLAGKRGGAAPCVLLASLAVQSLLCPWQTGTLGFALSYCAYAGVLLAPKRVHPLAAVFLTGALVFGCTLAVVAPVLGSSVLASLLVGPPASLLVVWLWYLSLAACLGLPLAARALTEGALLLDGLLSLAASWTILRVEGSALALAGLGLLTLLLAVRYAQFVRLGRMRRKYELEVRLRFAPGDQDGAESGRHERDEAVRSELPASGPDPGADR